MAIFDVKVVIVGDAGCGKSSLLQRLLTGRFQRDLNPTYAPEFGAKKIEVEVAACDKAGSRAGSTCSGANSGGGGGQDTGAVASRRVTCGIWDTSGSSRFHSVSRRFVNGADAVLVCWDPSSRQSWDRLRAWVGDARAQEPAALIYLCACKSDLLAPAQRVPAQQAAAAEPALEVEVERVNGGGGAAPISPWLWLQQQQQQQAQQQQQQQAQQQQAQQQAQQQQQQQQAQPQPRAEPQVAAAGWKSPARGAGGRRSLDAPTTPLKADRQSPSGSQGTPGSPVPATAAGRKVAAEHARAAAAEVVASLTGQAVPSPFAAAAQPPAGSGAWLPGQRPGSGASHASASPSGGGGGASPEGWQAASSGASHQRASKPGSRQQEQRRQQQERQRGASPEAGGSPAAGGRRVGTPRRRPRVRLQQESDGEGEEEEEAAPPLQQAAVPQAAIQHYCRTEGLPLVWVSSRTGEGVVEAFRTIAHEAVSQQQRRGAQERGLLQQGGRWPALRSRSRQGHEGERPGAPAASRPASRSPSLPPQQRPQAGGQAPRPQSAGSSSRRVGAAGGGEGAGRRSGSRSASHLPRTAAGGSRGGSRAGSTAGSTGLGLQQQQHEYVLGTSQFEAGRRRGPEEKSCCIS